MKFSPRKEPVIYVVEPYGGSVRKHLPSLPLVYWDDAAVTRGDGIFESLLIRDGKAANLARHGQRFINSALALELRGSPRSSSTCRQADDASACRASKTAYSRRFAPSLSHDNLQTPG